MKLRSLLNTIEAEFHSLFTGNSGVLHFKEDDRDKLFFGTGEKRGMVDYGFRFHQRDNICVFASRELGRSQQDGVEWSVTFMVKLAKKLGMTRGNGYSYLRAANEIAEKYGRVPAILCSNNNAVGRWEDWTRWTPEDDRLLEIASKYRTKPHGGYSRITSDYGAIQALKEGHSIFTAVNWHSAMNTPEPPGFWLRWSGRLIGGHAITYDEKEPTRFCNLQTFGDKYGDNGYAYTERLIPNIIGGAYTEAHYPTELLADMVATYYSGHIIRDVGDPKCYLIEFGTKKHIETMEEYFRLGGSHKTVSKEIINLIPNA